MRNLLRIASLRILFAAALAMAGFCLLLPEQSKANGLRVAVQIYQEYHDSPLPKTRNFKMCFKNDKNGIPKLTICTGPKSRKTRVPAGKKRRIKMNKRK